MCCPRYCRHDDTRPGGVYCSHTCSGVSVPGASRTTTGDLVAVTDANMASILPPGMCVLTLPPSRKSGGPCAEKTNPPRTTNMESALTLPGPCTVICGTVATVSHVHAGSQITTHTHHKLKGGPRIRCVAHHELRRRKLVIEALAQLRQADLDVRAGCRSTLDGCTGRARCGPR